MQASKRIKTNDSIIECSPLDIAVAANDAMPERAPAFLRSAGLGYGQQDLKNGYAALIRQGIYRLTGDGVPLLATDNPKPEGLDYAKLISAMQGAMEYTNIVVSVDGRVMNMWFFNSDSGWALTWPSRNGWSFISSAAHRAAGTVLFTILENQLMHPEGRDIVVAFRVHDFSGNMTSSTVMLSTFDGYYENRPPARLSSIRFEQDEEGNLNYAPADLIRRFNEITEAL